MITNVFHYTLQMLGIEILGSLKEDLPSLISLQLRLQHVLNQFDFLLIQRNSREKAPKRAKGPPNCFQLMVNWQSPSGSIKYLYSGRKSMKSENESSFIILHTCQHSLLSAKSLCNMSGCLIYHTHGWEATFNSCCFCRE